MKSKYSILIFLFSFLINCRSIPEMKIIPYLVSIETEDSIYGKIKSMNNVSFYLEHISTNEYKIHLMESEKSNQSNRMIFINDKFYPLFFDTDYLFYVKMKNNYPIVSKFENEDEKKSSEIKIPTIDERIKNKNLFLRDRTSLNIDWSIFWVVDSKGNLIKTNLNQTR